MRPESALNGQILSGSAPAKLNLRLKVEGRRPDGYHLLSMLNTTVAVCDHVRLTLLPGSGIQVSVSGDIPPYQCSELESADQNLAARAAAAFVDGFDLEMGVRLELQKTIPSQAGLGGGSSDAATVLLLLAEFFRQRFVEQVGMPAADYDQTVRSMAAALGADVMYLMRGGFAHVSGIGDSVVPLPGTDLHNTQCLLIVPPFGLRTDAVYGSLRRLFPEGEFSSDTAGRRFCSELCSGPDVNAAAAADRGVYQRVLALVENDLRPAVCECSPCMLELLEALGSVPDVVSSVTGSGSVCFLLSKNSKYLDKKKVARIADVVQPLGARVLETRLLANLRQ